MRLVALASAMLLLTGACQSVEGALRPALLAPWDGATVEQLKAALTKEMGRTVDLGPSDPTRSSTISVLPARAGPLNDRDMSLPTIFRLVSDGRTCALVREDTGGRIVLDGVTCRVAP